jgi:hypothetical protein
MTTFNIVNELTLAEKRVLISELKEAIRFDLMAKRIAKSKAKDAKIAERAAKATARAEKKAAKIAKLEARLADLKNPVGIKALKANRKPSAVKIVKAA